MTARPIRHKAQVPDRNGKIFYTSITSLSHISKPAGGEIPAELANCQPSDDFQMQAAGVPRTNRLAFI